MTFVRHTKSDKWIYSLMMGGNSQIRTLGKQYNNMSCGSTHCVLKCVKLLYCQLRAKYE